MSDQAEDRADVVVRPPLLWFLLVGAGYGLSWLLALRFVPNPWPNIWIGAGVLAIGGEIAFWSFRQFKDFRGDVDTHTPSSALVDTGPFAISRNPIYCGMFLGIPGAPIAADAFDILGAVVEKHDFPGRQRQAFGCRPYPHR